LHTEPHAPQLAGSIDVSTHAEPHIVRGAAHPESGGPVSAGPVSIGPVSVGPVSAGPVSIEPTSGETVSVLSGRPASLARSPPLSTAMSATSKASSGCTSIE
jgi:hypothetical protein